MPRVKDSKTAILEILQSVRTRRNFAITDKKSLEGKLEIAIEHVKSLESRIGSCDDLIAVANAEIVRMMTANGIDDNEFNMRHMDT